MALHAVPAASLNPPRPAPPPCFCHAAVPQDHPHQRVGGPEAPLAARQVEDGRGGAWAPGVLLCAWLAGPQACCCVYGSKALRLLVYNGHRHALGNCTIRPLLNSCVLVCVPIHCLPPDPPTNDFPTPTPTPTSGGGAHSVAAGGGAAQAHHRQPQGHAGPAGGAPHHAALPCYVLPSIVRMLCVPCAPVVLPRPQPHPRGTHQTPLPFSLTPCQVHLLDFPNIVITGSELQLPFQVRQHGRAGPAVALDCANPHLPGHPAPAPSLHCL